MTAALVPHDARPMLMPRLTAAISLCVLLASQPPGSAFASIRDTCRTISRTAEALSLPADARQPKGVAASRGPDQAEPAPSAAGGDGAQVGRTVPDAASAIAALRQEADGGDPEAQYELGMAYVVGVGVERDPKAAAAWMEKAALQGFPAAVADLGVMYLNGDGVPRDRVMACALLTAAVERAAPAEIRPEVACGGLSDDDRERARRISVDPTLWQRP